MAHRFSQGENMQFNSKEDFGQSFKMNGLRDVPVKLREKFQKMIAETFVHEDETPFSFEYSKGVYEYEGEIYLHKLEVAYAFWDGYFLHVEYLNFLS